MRGGKRKLAAATAALQAKATAAALQEAVLDLANRKGVRCCVECHATSTPQWREGPMGPKTLCNACGVRRQRLLRKQQQASSGVAPTAPVAAVQARRRTSSRAQQMQALLTEDYVYGSASDASSEDTEMAGRWSSHDPHHRTASASALPGQLRAPSTRAVRSHHVVHVQHAQPRTHSDGHAAASRGQLHPHGYPSRDELPVLPHPYDYDYEHDLETRDDSGNEEESAAYDLLFFAGVDVESGAEGGARLPCSLSNPNPGPCSRPVRRRVTPRRYTEYERHEGAEEQEEQQQQRYAREVELEADETGFEGPEEVAEAGVAVERLPMVVASRKRRPAPPAGSLAIPPLHAMSSVNSGPDAPYAELSELQQLQQQQSRPVLIPSVPASSGPSTSGTSGLVLPPVSNSSHPASSAPNAPPSPLHMPLLASLPLLPLSIPDLAHAPLTAAALAASAPAPVSLPTDSLPPLASLSSSAAAAPADAAALLRVWEDAQRAQAQLLEARSAQAAVEEVVEEQRQVAEAAQGEAVAASQRLMAEVRALADRYCLWAALAQLRAEGPAAAAAAPAAAVAPSGGADAAAATSDGTAAHPPAAAAAL